MHGVQGLDTLGPRGPADQTAVPGAPGHGRRAVASAVNQYTHEPESGMHILACIDTTRLRQEAPELQAMFTGLEASGCTLTLIVPD